RLTSSPVLQRGSRSNVRTSLCTMLSSGPPPSGTLRVRLTRGPAKRTPSQPDANACSNPTNPSIASPSAEPTSSLPNPTPPAQPPARGPGGGPPPGRRTQPPQRRRDRLQVVLAEAQYGP